MLFPVKPLINTNPGISTHWEIRDGPYDILC